MAHEITQRANGMAEMAYTGAKPWHGLGQELQQGAPIEQWLTSAGMDWRIQRSKVRFATAHGQQGTELAEWADYHVLMRSDTKAPLGMVSDTFNIVQPSEVLEFFRDLTEAAGFKLSTAGTLHGGRKFWALASVGEQANIVGNDIVKANLLFATAADGTMRSTVKNLATRVVCANTLAIAMGEKGGRQVQVSHRSEFDAQAVKSQMGLTVTAFNSFVRNAREMAQRQVSPDEARAFVAKLFSMPSKLAAEPQALVLDKAPRGYGAVLDLFNGSGRGSMLPGVRGTAWGLVNAVTEYADHHVRARSYANRLDSAWFGQGDDMKQQAMTQAQALLVA